MFQQTCSMIETKQAALDESEERRAKNQAAWQQERAAWEVERSALKALLVKASAVQSQEGKFLEDTIDEVFEKTDQVLQVRLRSVRDYC